MKTLAFRNAAEEESITLATTNAPLTLPAGLNAEASRVLVRMFRDPRVLEKQERLDLIAQLRSAVELAPNVPEVRVLLGMALSVDLQAQEAMEQLRDAVNMAPDCFIAHLKFGELLMRLRVCGQAEEETHKAACLASNAAQSDLARRQAATIRTMQREGIERGGYRAVLPRLFGFGRKSARQEAAPALVASK